MTNNCRESEVTFFYLSNRSTGISRNEKDTYITKESIFYFMLMSQSCDKEMSKLFERKVISKERKVRISRKWYN